jgi:tRNA dimethylallyltransferase
MDVGTAKPTTEERKGVPHHLLDVVDPDEGFNAATYRNLAIPVLESLASRQRVCFVVGGSGLYIKSLLGGLLQCPPGDPTFRNELRRHSEAHGPGSLHERLRAIDPETADKVHPNDELRTIRALEIIHLTHQALSTLVKKHGFRESPFQTLKIHLQVHRAQLYHRINQRSLSMIEAGLVKETEALLRKGYSPELKSMKALGYRHMVSFLQGDCDLDKAVCQLQADTRRYAKRQLTWFRADPEMVWMGPDDVDGIIGRIDAFYTNRP